MSGSNTTVSGTPNSAAASTDSFLKQSAAGTTGNSTGAQIATMVYATSVALTNQTTATGATAGVAALPTGPVAFLQISVNGTAFKVPYYTV